MNIGSWHESPSWLAAGWTMIHFLWIGGAVWLCAAVLRAMVARLGPDIRYLVALGLLLVTAVVPGALFLSARPASRENRLELRPGVPLALRTAENSRPGAATWISPDAIDEGSGRASEASVVARPFAVQSLDGLMFFGCRWLPWVWLAGAPLTLLILAVGVAGADRLRRHATPLDRSDVAAVCRRLQAALRIRQRVAVAICERLGGPILVGIIRPAILLPPAVLAECSMQQIEMILLHELAHVRRCDNLVNLGQRLIEALLFFHPVVWWLSRWVRLERENCCDQIVLAHAGPPELYAETLAALAIPGLALPGATGLGDGHLALRLRHILQIEEETMNFSRKALLVAAGLIVFCGGLAVWSSKPAQRSQRVAAGAKEGVTKAVVAKEKKPPGPHRVGPGDILNIDLRRNVRSVQYPLRAGDELMIRASKLLPISPEDDEALKEFKTINGPYVVQPEGTIELGPEYGSVIVEGLTIGGAKEAIRKHLQNEVGLVDPKVSVTMPNLQLSPFLSGEHQVFSDGTVFLGIHGRVKVEEMTLEEAAGAIEKQLTQYFHRPEVSVNLLSAQSPFP
ncbi:MAG: M56 family metallopeptidase [Planctomycetaceae bacterium]